MAVATAASSWRRSPSAWASTRPTSATSTTTTCPKSLESYSQEIGRAGRDGEPSIVEMLACPDDVPTLENFAYGDTPTRARAARAGRRSCSARASVRREPVRALDAPRPAPARAADGADVPGAAGRAAAGNAVLRGVRGAALESLARSSAKFEGERAQFVQGPVRHGEEGTHLVHDPSARPRREGERRSRACARSSYLEEQG